MELARLRQRRRIVKLLEDEVLDVDIVNAAALELGLAVIPSEVRYTPRHRLPNQARRDDGKGYVYVVSAGNGLYKIGSARRVDRRIQALQTASSTPLTLVHSIVTEQYTHTVVESSLHRKLADKRVKGEWFKLDRDDIAALRAL